MSGGLSNEGAATDYAQEADESDAVLEQVLRCLTLGPPAWFPYGAELDTEFQIPTLPMVDASDVPELTRPFDRIPTSAQRRKTLVNFYVDEDKLTRLLRNPMRFVARFEGTWGMTSPDFSVWRQSPPQMRVMATWLNRSLGRFFADHGITVVANLRWADETDYCHCFAGIPRGSVVAISTHGVWRNHSLRYHLVRGIRPMIEAIQPRLLLVHGTLDSTVRREAGRDVAIAHLEPLRSQVRNEVA